MLQDQRDQARAEYERAHAALTESPDYRRLVQAKLNALGQDPQADSATATGTAK